MKHYFIETSSGEIQEINFGKAYGVKSFDELMLYWKETNHNETINSSWIIGPYRGVNVCEIKSWWEEEWNDIS